MTLLSSSSSALLALCVFVLDPLCVSLSALLSSLASCSCCHHLLRCSCSMLALRHSSDLSVRPLTTDSPQSHASALGHVPDASLIDVLSVCCPSLPELFFVDFVTPALLSIFALSRTTPHLDSLHFAAGFVCTLLPIVQWSAFAGSFGGILDALYSAHRPNHRGITSLQTSIVLRYHCYPPLHTQSVSPSRSCFQEVSPASIPAAHRESGSLSRHYHRRYPMQWVHPTLDKPHIPGLYTRESVSIADNFGFSELVGRPQITRSCTLPRYQTYRWLDTRPYIDQHAASLLDVVLQFVATEFPIRCCQTPQAVSISPPRGHCCIPSLYKYRLDTGYLALAHRAQ
mmetsp:Transcript_66821/g.106234  ORF Transcript_66821/g.106234 Transcript_66821/m.106234 type:complete len:342 (+) Transcript_66821:343-1368(+)